MEIGKFSLDDFTIHKNFKKIGGEAIVFKAWHPRLGYIILNILNDYSSQVAIKEWMNAAHKLDNEIKLLIQVKNL